MLVIEPMVDEKKIIKAGNVQPRTASIVDYLKNQLADIDYNQAWNNFFAQCEASIKLIITIQDAIATNLIDLRKKEGPKPRQENIYRLHQLWDGGCFITRKRDPKNPIQFIPDSDEFHYDTNLIDSSDPNLEVIPCPALDNMTPEEQKKDMHWGVLVSTEVPLYLAIPNHNYKATIAEGGFIYRDGMKLMPKFTEADLSSKIKKVDRVSRYYYNFFMKLLKNKWLENWSPISNDYQKIITYLEEGDMENVLESEQKGNKRSVFGKVI